MSIDSSTGVKGECVSGFYGKLPAFGDFVWRRLPREFRSQWDPWLQEGMRCSRERLGEPWLDMYLGAPLWRFALRPNVIDDNMWVGVLMASVDRAGRYFPFTVATPCDATVSIVDLPTLAAGWLTHSENLMLDALANDALDVELLDEAISSNRLDIDPVPSRMALETVRRSDSSLWLACHRGAEVAGAAMSQALVTGALDKGDIGSVWWTAGGAHFAPTYVFATGLIAPEEFHGLLSGHDAAIAATDGAVETAQDA